MKKKRGAPIGNQNAYKHGFYSAAFKAAEQRLLSGMPAHDLSAEIELIRVGTLRLLLALDEAHQPADFATQITALRVLNLSAHSITSLIRTQAWAFDAREGLADFPGSFDSAGTDFARTSGPEPASEPSDIEPAEPPSGT